MVTPIINIQTITPKEYRGYLAIANKSNNDPLDLPKGAEDTLPVRKEMQKNYKDRGVFLEIEKRPMLAARGEDVRKAKEIELLIKALDDEDVDVRDRAVEALGELAKSNISPELKAKMAEPLFFALGDNEARVRNKAVWAFGELMGSNISPALKTKMIKTLAILLGDADKDTRYIAALPLLGLAESNISPELKAKMVEPLIKALGDKDKYVRRIAARALGELAESNISPELKAKMAVPLIKALGDEDKDPYEDGRCVRDEAEWALNVLAKKTNISPALKAKIQEALKRRGR